MSSVQALTSLATHGNTGDYTCGSNIIIDYSSDSCFSIATTAIGTDNSWITMTSAGKNKLFPNGTAHPIKADISFRGSKLGISTCNISLHIDGTQILNQQFTGSWVNYTFTGRTDAVIISAAKITEIKWLLEHGALTGGSVNDVTVTFYFHRYDFSASAGNNVTSAAVSSSTGYDGDSVTYSCVLASGAEFDGWYSAGTKVSASQTYTHTVNGADLALEARAIIPIVTKALSATYNGAQLQGFPISVQADAPITYSGVSKGTVPFSGGAKTLTCANKLCSGSIGIGGKTLQCAGKIMASNVVCQIT